MAKEQRSPFIKAPVVITLIIGLPGSGKTTLANSKASQTEGIVIDDIKTRNDIEDAINDGYTHIYVTDPHLCHKAVLENAKNYISSLPESHTIECIFFKNNSDQCIKNVALRNDGRNVIPTIQRYAKIYTPPTDAMNVYGES